MASSKTTTKLSHLLKDGIFTFVVGPSRERYNVHISVLGNISEPLKYMMTNDKMEESIKKEAILENVDPEAFSQLLEFAYTGVCDQLICEYHITNGEGKKYPKYDIEQEESQANRQGTGFCARRYGCPDLSLSHELLDEHIDRHLTTDSQGSGLFEYAKLYVLADKYMVKNLQAITLHKLHRNLAAYKIHDEAIDEVIDLVLYTYTNTSEGGNILDGTADKLRDLVIAYVVDRASDLLKYESFRAMLAAGGAQTADFMALTFAPPAPKTT